MNKLVIIIANRDIERQLAKQLVAEKFIFTRINSAGGYLRKKNVTIMLGVEDDKVDSLIELIKEAASVRSSLIGSDSGATLSSESGMPAVPLGAAPLKIGGATVFVVPVEKSLRF